MCVKDLEKIKEYTSIFNKAIGYCDVPWEYFASGKTYIWYEKNIPVAGFVLRKGYYNLRSISQLPMNLREEYDSKYYHNLSDFTGFYISKRIKYKMLFGAYLTLICLFHSNGNFIYNYLKKDTGLEKYYGLGKPVRIFSGVTSSLPGDKESLLEENVEILTKFGIVRIFIVQLLRNFGIRR